MIERQHFLVGMAAWLAAGLCVWSLGAAKKAEPVRFDKATMSMPKLIHKVAPKYPQEAKKEGIEGTIVIDAVIAEDGHVRETRVKRGGDTRLVEAARNAVGQWRYKPVRDDNGEPQEVLFTVTIRFALK
jgi:protein TonB